MRKILRKAEHLYAALLEATREDRGPAQFKRVVLKGQLYLAEHRLEARRRARNT